ncbi:betaine/proline/choline family ABC transporter ATP-binding protein [Egicoccus sp. AB-alg2]|uniref:betaine/proline/choline family ABC transporter ATP-binding protein n=1 Tax=Egicoccus sp. AB-alg2 TaxID=3242693 RepID=UPI00359EE8A7
MTAASEPMIRLEALTKHYPGQRQPAVDALDLAIPEGEIVMLVGPSGCGKTTTLEMINRLVEPSSGRIILEGEDVTHIDPDALRRRIGYAIQQIGLFPHRTIAQNIATVPRLLGWSKERIRDRVDELLEMVGLEPTEYRDRYPKALSGGQRQRVGVARAMAADPPVLLMDEPFGATDPITRNRLQDEFRRIQDDIGKTIVFVTHDIDEAITLGDRIAILQVSAQIAQYDTPENILSNPADDFVVDFLGSGSVFKRLDLARVRDAHPDRDWPTLPVDADVEAARRLTAGDHRPVLVVDEGKPLRWLRPEHLADAPELRDAGLAVGRLLQPTDRLSEALTELLVASVPAAPVIDGNGRYLGVLDLATLHRAVADLQSEARGTGQQGAAT